MMVITKFEINSSNDIYKALEQITTENKLPYRRKYKPDHIFDEDKSVRWNREEVERLNNAIDQEYKDAQLIQRKSLDHLDRDVKCYIVDQLVHKVDNAVVDMILNRVKSEHEAWWEYIDQYIDFADDLISIVNKEK